MDPLLSLSLAVQSNPGVYAVLLGSGVSRAAQIPTGWEVTLDLVQKVAIMQGADVGADPAGWFAEQFGSPPDYSELLERLAPIPAERQRLLRAYFEPTAEEREEGIKVPTECHRAIARLAAKGYIRVIVTTNFDRLMEQALDAESIVPTVISTPDSAAGAPPLMHSGVTVIKLHGDYRDSRIKNTPAELEVYEGAMAELLDRVLDEFGLIVAGWSAKWDPALRSALQRCPTRRYSTYWTDVGAPGEEAASLISHRSGEFIQVAGADAFFVSLEEKVLALESLRRAHPLSVATAIAAVKRYLPEERFDIRLHDLVLEEATRVRDSLDDPVLRRHLPKIEPADLLHRLQKCEAYAEILWSMVAVGCFWGRPRHQSIWVRALETLGSIAEIGSGTWNSLLRYPATLTMYAGALGAIASENYDLLRALLVDTKVREHGQEDTAAVLQLHKWAALEWNHARLLPGMNGRPTPLSDRLHEILRPSFASLIPLQARYDDLFDRMEYLIALVCSDLQDQRWGPVGRYQWRSRHTKLNPQNWLKAEIESRGVDSSLLRAGLFKGSPEHLKTVQTGFDDVMDRSPWAF